MTDAADPTGEEVDALEGAGPEGAGPEGAGGDAVDGDGPLVEPERLPAALEALLVVAEDPLDSRDVAAALGVPQDVVQAAMEELATAYAVGKRGFRLRATAGGWRLFSAPEHDGVVERVLVAGRQGRLSQAALETLSVVAYRQPVTRGRISAIRGVSVDGVMRTLVTRGLVVEDGQEAGATLYRTTPLFLDKLGIASLDALPPIAPLLPETDELDELST